MVPMIKVRIENAYTDGHESVSEVTIDQAPTALTVEAIDAWFIDVVWDFTGDGHYIDVYEATGIRLGSCYTATVVEAPALALVGAVHEWLD